MRSNSSPELKGESGGGIYTVPITVSYPNTFSLTFNHCTYSFSLVLTISTFSEILTLTKVAMPPDFPLWLLGPLMGGCFVMPVWHFVGEEFAVWNAAF